MTINYSATLGSATYIQRLRAFIKAVEGEKFSPYVDITGNPTIGWGFALNAAHLTTKKALVDIIETVLGVNTPNRMLSQTASDSEQGFENSLIATLNKTWPADLTKNQNGPSTLALQVALNAILASRAADIANGTNGYTASDKAAIGTPSLEFKYSTADQISATFNIIKAVIDARLDSSPWVTVPDTNERIAFFAMQYLGAMNSGMKDSLNTALNQSDPNDARAQAWYTIRYLNKLGWEQRSYMEAAMFGLVAPGQAMTDGAALATYRIYTQHATTMQLYDKAHSVALSNANSALGSLADAEDLPTSLQPAANQLIQDYGHGKTFDPLHIWVASAGDSKIDRARDSAADLIIGGFCNDTLVGVRKLGSKPLFDDFLRKVTVF